MPDKQNDNKFMSMLERRGIVRKADSEEESTEPEPVSVRTRPEADLRSLFGTPTNEFTNVTPASRQPVPGLSNPIMPGERKAQAEREQPPPIEERAAREEPKPVPAPEPEPPRPIDPQVEPKTVEIKEERVSRERPEPFVERIPREGPRPVEQQRPPLFFTRSDPFKDESPKTEEPAAAPPERPIFVQPPEPPPPVDYTERYLEIDDLFEVLALKSRRTDTIYLVEEYLKTLPDSLPDESRREIVRKIVTASGFDFDLLMGDGVLRVKMLKDYAEKFAQHTEDYVAARNAELAELEQKSIGIQKLIENRRELHKKQFFAIESEAQRLKEILTFITG